MLSVFIGYGGTEAEAVAVELDRFLKKETDMNVFVASPQSSSLPANAHNYSRKIIEKMLGCDIAIFVCHKSSTLSAEMIKEIKFFRSNGLSNRIIFFSASDNCIPSKFLKLWRPLHFTPEKPEESFCRLTNHIYRSYVENIQQLLIVPEESEMPLQ